MLEKKSGHFPGLYLLFFYIVLFISCGQPEKAPDVSKSTLSLNAKRFETDLIRSGPDAPFSLRKKYPSFFDLYFFQIVRIGSRDSAEYAARIRDFATDSDIVAIYRDTQSKFSDFSKQDQELTEAFKFYHVYFPSHVVPQTVTFISGFNNAIICADSLLGIGLDWYLGKESKYYQALHFPYYKVQKMSGEYITADAMKGWLQSEWTEAPTNADLLSHMIYSGKILYALHKVMPDAKDSLLMGYTASQMAWCKKNEKKVWSFFIDNKLLFSSGQNQILKFVTEGPTTNGFPKESPGNLGQWIGYQIVDAYMKSQSETTVTQLMDENDYKKILQASGYKP
jgi:gliding motility-associated lipoprotein GldB